MYKRKIELIASSDSFYLYITGYGKNVTHSTWFFLVERQFLSVKPQKNLGEAWKWLPRVNSQKIVSVLNHGGTMGAAQPLEQNLLHINIQNTSYNIHSLCCHIFRYNLCR